MAIESNRQRYNKSKQDHFGIVFITCSIAFPLTLAFLSSESQSSPLPPPLVATQVFGHYLQKFGNNSRQRPQFIGFCILLQSLL